LADLIRESRAVLIGPVRQELLSGVREEDVFQRLLQDLRAFQDEASEVSDFEEAARFNIRCRAAGVSGSPIDFLICAMASRREMAIFTIDDDFHRYAAHLPIRLLEPEPRDT
jgi:predicted nucleic acid-binding protein